MPPRNAMILAIKTMTDNWPAFIDDLEATFDEEYSAGYDTGFRDGYDEGHADGRHDSGE